MRLKDKVAIITGGTGGIGAATARDMVNEGAKVIIADLNDELGESLAKELNNTIYVHTNVKREADVKKMIDKAECEFGKIDILFNNAGINIMGAMENITIQDWNSVFSVNLLGVFLCSKYVVKAFKKHGGGSIINCASVLGHVGQTKNAAYTACKAAIINYTKTIALEYAKNNIRVNSISPGYIDTPFLDGNREIIKVHLVSILPLARLGRAEEVAKAVVFLASDDASYITGADLLIDGGYAAK